MDLIAQLTASAEKKAREVLELAEDRLKELIDTAPNWPGWDYFWELGTWTEKPHPYVCDAKNLPLGWVRISIQERGYCFPYYEVSPLLNDLQFPVRMGYEERLTIISEKLVRAMNEKEYNGRSH